jgi:hypothetical protein
MFHRVIAGWSIWQIPRIAITWVLFIDGAALVFAAVVGSPVKGSDIDIAISLAGLSISYSGVSYTWERARRALWERTAHTGQLYRNLLAVWCFAAAVTLPTELAAGVVILGAIAEWPSLKISTKATPYRYVYSTAAAVLATVTAHECLQIPGANSIGLSVATAAYMATGLLAVIAAQVVARQRDGIRAFLRWDAHRLEALTLAIGLATAATVLSRHAALLWLCLPVTIAVQRWAVRSDLRHAEDPTSPPMSEHAWLLIAQEVIRACSVGAVMRIETTEPAVVSYLARVKAGCDALGMAGDSGVAVLMPYCPGENADALAIRMRAILRREGVPAEVAVAAKPRDGQSLDDLLAVSEAELITRVAATRSARFDIPEA